MSIQVDINAITGQSPYDVYICQSGGTDCFYIDRITTIPYSFIVPSPYDKSYSYMLKIIDGNNSTISGTSSL